MSRSLRARRQSDIHQLIAQTISLRLCKFKKDKKKNEKNWVILAKGKILKKNDVSSLISEHHGAIQAFPKPSQKKSISVIMVTCGLKNE